MAGFRQGSFDFESAKRPAGSGECKKNDSLLEHFDFLLSQATQATRDQAGADRLRAHLLAQLVCLGRHTLSALLTTNGQLHQDWSADYRLYSQQRLEPDELFAQIRRGAQQSLDPDQALVVAMDDSILRKRGRKIPGVGYRRDPLSPPFHLNLVLGMRFVQLSALVRQQDGFSRMIPIDFQQAPLPHRPPRNAPEEEWQLYQAQLAAANINKVALSRVNFLRDQLDAEQDQEHPRDLRIVVDGRFTNAKLLKHLPHNTTLIGRIRRDAKLFYPPLAQAATGRKRVYGPEAPTPQELLKDPAVDFQYVQAQLGERSCQFRVKSLGPLRALQAGNCHQLQLLVIAPLGYRLRKGSKLLYRQPAFLICTDPTLAIQTLLQNYLWRWDIEVNFRDQKNLLGVGEAQVRHPNSVQSQPATAVAAYGLLLLAAAQCDLKALNQPKWRSDPQLKRLSTATLLNLLRHELWSASIRPKRFTHFRSQASLDYNALKPQPQLSSAVFYASA
jgi:DDE superfamily endonuclease